jgi:hypothetical protein
MLRSYEDIVASAGGAWTDNAIGDWFPGDVLVAAKTLVSEIGQEPWPYLPDDVCLPAATPRVTLVRSTQLDARVQLDARGEHVVLIPVGLIARTWVLVRLLLSIGDDMHKIMFLNSPLDEFDPEIVFVPQKYQPVFGDIEEEDEFWSGLEKLNRASQNTYAEDAGLITLYIVCFVCSHELHHVHYHHLEMEKVLKDSNRTADIERFKRGLELQADDFAAGHVVRKLIEQNRADNGSEQDYWSLFLRLAFGATTFLGMMSPAMKYIRNYRGGYYTHPIIRYQIFARSVFDGVGGENSDPGKLWYEAEHVAWEHCMWTFSALSRRVMADHFSETPPGKLLQPLQGLMYGGRVAASRLDAMVKDEFANMTSVTEACVRYLRTGQL